MITTILKDELGFKIVYFEENTKLKMENQELKSEQEEY